MIASALFLENATETSHSLHGKYPEYETFDVNCICANVVITSQSSADLQTALTLLESYCLHWSLEVNIKNKKKLC